MLLYKKLLLMTFGMTYVFFLTVIFSSKLFNVKLCKYETSAYRINKVFQTIKHLCGMMYKVQQTFNTSEVCLNETSQCLAVHS